MSDSEPVHPFFATPLAAAFLVSVVACSAYESQVDAPNHDIEVVANGITRVDGLAFHPSGAVLATQEFRGGGVVRIDPVSGSFTYVVRGLADPDNIVVANGDLYVTEEDQDGRIVRIDHTENVSTFAANLDSPEGLDLGPDGKLYVAEHSPDGSVYRYSLDGRRKRIGSAPGGEGLRVLPDLSIVVAETEVGRIVLFAPDGEKSVLAVGLSAPDGVLFDAAENRVLVTEDTAPGRLVAIDLETSEMSVIATGMHSPQTMLLEPDGAILVAEQGEHRILRLRPKGVTP